MKIKVMDDILANKIAAGEVVERPSSVVKELVENSIDAGSTEIKVELKESGISYIKVTDNGCGMDKNDAKLSFTRHATSKVKSEDDLFHILTLGFRGEALPSIASVSKVNMETCNDNESTNVYIEGGKIINITPAIFRKGTSIEVKDLFYNTPARLKHITNLYTELAVTTDYMNKIALSHPNIKFIFSNNDNIILNTDGRGSLLKCISNVFGIEVCKKSYEIENSNNDYTIKGYISYPEINRSNRNHMITIVNGRVVKNNSLNKAINDSYHTYKPDNRYPIVVINITCDASLIDVNIHPTKMDIKFSKQDKLIELIETTIKSIIGKKNLIPKIELAKEDASVISKPIYEEIKIDFDKPREVYEPTILINEDLIEDKVEVDTKESRLPIIYPVGLVHGTYIVCENEDGMYLIDQHAAKERVNYEIYKEKLGNPSKDTIDMLLPLTLEFSTSEFIILKQNFDLIRSIGIGIEEFGLNSIIIKSHPVWLPKGGENEALRKILDVVVNIEKNFTIEKFNEKLAIMLSCKMSIKANTNLTLAEMNKLVSDLRACKQPFNCPHGRPTVIIYTISELEKQFKRSGFELLS